MTVFGFIVFFIVIGYLSWRQGIAERQPTAEEELRDALLGPHDELP